MAGRPRALPRIDLIAECIWRDGERIGVTPKAFLVLRYLMERPEQLVTKDELFDAIWPNTAVIDTVLNVAVGDLRRALGDSAKQSRFIATVHRRGFRWIGPLVNPLPPVDEDIGPFVGRADTLAELERRYHLAVSGRRQMVFVTGEPGIGKTTVVEEFQRLLAAKPLSVRSGTTPNSVTANSLTACLLARGQCVDRYGAAETYRPLIDAAETLLHAGGQDVRALFRKHAPTWMLQMRDVLDADELEALQRLVQSSTLELMQRELERVLEAVSAERAVVVALEDLHWSDAATVGLLGALAVRRDPARLLILATYRPFDAVAAQHPIVRLKHELVAKRQCVELTLDGLTGEDVASYLDAHFVNHRLPPTLAPTLQAQTSGNPLFLLNALADFEQRGWLCQRDDGWECSVDVDTLGSSMPDSTRELIAFRLDQLNPPAQALLEAASLCGMSFSTQAIAAASERSNEDVEAECRRLTNTLFLRAAGESQWPDGSRGLQLTFRHSHYRQILDDRVAGEHRQHLHRQIAQRMEAGYGAQVGEIATTLSFHYEHAGDILRAVDFIEIAAQRANTRRVMYEAMTLYQRAVTLLEAMPANEVQERRLREARAAYALLSIASVGGRHATSASVLEGVLEAGRSLPVTREHVATIGASGVTQIAAGQFHAAQRTGEQILVIAGSDAEPEVLLAAHVTTGSALYYLGEIDRAMPHLEQAVTLIPGSSSAGRFLDELYDPAVPGLCNLGMALTVAGRAERGAQHIADGLARARDKPSPWYLSFAFASACGASIFRRDLAELRRRATELQTYCEQGRLFIGPLPIFLLSWVALIERRDAGLMEPVLAAFQGVEQMNNAPSLHRSFSMLAGAHLCVGQHEQAAVALERAFDVRGEAQFYDVELYRQRAELILARAGESPSDSDRQDASDTLEHAIEIASRQGSRLLGLRATVDLCRLRLATDQRDPALEQLTQALAAFEEGLDDTDVRDARALLRHENA